MEIDGLEPDDDRWEEIADNQRIRRARDGEGHLHLIEAHRNADGRWCYGAISTNPRDTPTWELRSEEPLHVEPSLLCRACGNHGWIRDGRWTPA